MSMHDGAKVIQEENGKRTQGKKKCRIEKGILQEQRQLMFNKLWHVELDSI